MSSIRRYYQELDVMPGATPDEIKEAYRQQVKRWHPDRFVHDPKLQREAEEKIKLINEAYNRLRQYRRDMQPGARPATVWNPTPAPPRPAAPTYAIRTPSPHFGTPPPQFDRIDASFFEPVDLYAAMEEPAPVETPPPSAAPSSPPSRDRRVLRGPLAALAMVALALVAGLAIGGITGWLIGGQEGIAQGAVAMGSLTTTIAAIVGGMGLLVNGR